MGTNSYGEGRRWGSWGTGRAITYWDDGRWGFCGAGGANTDGEVCVLTFVVARLPTELVG